MSAGRRLERVSDTSGAQLSLQFQSMEERAGRLLARLRAMGFTTATSCRLTLNRLTMVSFSRATLRVHESFSEAPDEVLRAMVTFFTCRQSAARHAARRVILDHAGARPAGRARRRKRNSSLDADLASRLAAWHRELNERHFEGKLSPIEPHVSRRMRSRLGHYSPASPDGGAAAEIVISRRHMARDGLERARDTLLHEMVHQWQDENGLPLSHGADFRTKAREVGTAPYARRPRALSFQQ
jgi:hypothetical protein